MERWLSGRKRTIRNRLTGDCSWVRIPPSPYDFKSFYFTDKQLFFTLEESAL